MKRLAWIALLACACSSGSAAVPAIDAGACSATIDLENPPNCPPDRAATKCANQSKITCPANACMYPAAQTGEVIDLRIARNRLLAPSALLSLTTIAVDPNVNPRCFNGGNDSFNWLLSIDKVKGTLTVGGARPSTDGKTYRFLDESIDGAKLGMLCPGFVGPATPLDLRPRTSRLTLTGDTFTSEQSAKINVPIFDPTTGIPIVLPLSEAFMKNVTLSEGGSCVGSFDPSYWCDGDTLGWTTGGAVIAKITVEEADHVPVKSAGCQSLCAILANDPEKTDKTTKTCKKNADGSYPEIGDTCVGGASCKNAWRLVATFAAYGVTITK